MQRSRISKHISFCGDQLDNGFSCLLHLPSKVKADVIIEDTLKTSAPSPLRSMNPQPNITS